MNSSSRECGMNSLNDSWISCWKRKKKDQEIVIKLYTILWRQGQAVKLKTCFQIGLLSLVCLYSKIVKNYLAVLVNLIGEI
jgi:hypothetical protein